MSNVTHTRVRWTSQNGVEFAPKLSYSGEYSAANGWTDIRHFYVNLSEYDIDLVVKPNYTVPRIAVDSGAELAINGPFAFDDEGFVKPIGHIVKDEKLVQSTVSADKWADFIMRKNGEIEVGQVNPADVSGIQLAFSSTPQIVRDGAIYVNTWGEGTPKDVYAERRPRTGLGIAADKRLVIVVVDGDSRSDAGLRVDELAAVMIKLGAVEAINLDGGGSSCVVENGQAISANKGDRRLGASLCFKRKATSVSTPSNYRIAHINKRPNTRPGIPMTPKYLMVHTTNNFSSGANAEMHRRFLNQTTSYVSFHLCVDDVETVELMPLNERAFHAGDGGDGPFNSRSISMEICVHNLVNGKLHPNTYRNAVETAAKILATHGVELAQHRDVPERSWKNCPHTDVMDYAQFKRDVMAKITPKKYRATIDGLTKEQADKIKSDYPSAQITEV